MKRLHKKWSVMTAAALAATAFTTAASAAPSGPQVRVYTAGNLPGLAGQLWQDCDWESLMDLLKNGAFSQEPDCERPGRPESPGEPESGPEGGTPNLPEDEESPGEEESLSDFAQQLIKLVNEERAAAGQESLRADPLVQAAAQTRAAEQAERFSHTRPDGSSCFTALADAGAPFQAAGENIAYGQATPQKVMEDWMNSDGHRANILSTKFQRIGVGVYQAGNGTIYWTQMFTD